MDTALAPQRVLLVAPNWVGDSIFFLPSVRALRRHFPQAQLELLAKPNILALHRANTLFNAFHELEGPGYLRRFRSHWRLRSRAFELALIYPPSFSSALAALLSGAKRRLGRLGEGRGILLTQSLPKAARQRHVADEYLELTEALGAEPLPEDKYLGLPLSEEGVQEQNRLFREQRLQAGPPLVALCPTSAFGPSKCWPPKSFVSLARALKEQRYQPYLLGAPKELEYLKPIAEAAGNLPILLPSLPGLAACLAASGLVVANDSGPLHLAAAVGARCVGLYGPVSPEWSAPLSHRAAVLYSGESCSPCYQATCPLGHHHCMTHLSPEMVMEKLMEVLKR